MRQLILVVALAVAQASPAQQPPATDVFLMDLRDNTHFNLSNSPGYDNQPSFINDDAVLFSSNRDGKQTDIYRFDIMAKRLTQLTKSPDNEYSPLVTPDGKSFSVIRQETDGTQRVWRFDLDGSNPRLVLADVKPVGYHAWIDATHLALFILGSEASPGSKLHVADTATGKSELVETGIGRSITIRPKSGAVVYMTSAQPRMIKEFDFKTRATRPLLAPLDGSQDIAWAPDGQVLFMASGAMILTANTSGSPWIPRSLSATQGITQITRLAVSPNGRFMAVVAAEPRTP